MEVDQPPASTVRRFLALLEQSDIDFSEELGEKDAGKGTLLYSVAILACTRMYGCFEGIMQCLHDAYCLSTIFYTWTYIFMCIYSMCEFTPPFFTLQSPECQRLKAQAVQEIRSNQQLEQDLHVMDIKIGLLVKNRISLEDVVTHSSQIKKKERRRGAAAATGDSSAVSATGLGGLTKANQEKLEASGRFCTCVCTSHDLSHDCNA